MWTYGRRGWPIFGLRPDNTFVVEDLVLTQPVAARSSSRTRPRRGWHHGKDHPGRRETALPSQTFCEGREIQRGKVTAPGARLRPPRGAGLSPSCSVPATGSTLFVQRPRHDPHDQLIPQLKQLRLSGILETLELRNRPAVEKQSSFSEFLQWLRKGRSGAPGAVATHRAAAGASPRGPSRRLTSASTRGSSASRSSISPLGTSSSVTRTC